MSMLRAGIIAQRVDVTQQLFPGVAAAALFVGTIAAAGGKLLVDTIDHLTGDVKGALRDRATPQQHQAERTI
jgi:hypothetical protein